MKKIALIAVAASMFVLAACESDGSNPPPQSDPTKPSKEQPCSRETPNCKPV